MSQAVGRGRGDVLCQRVVGSPSCPVPVQQASVGETTEGTASLTFTDTEHLAREGVGEPLTPSCVDEEQPVPWFQLPTRLELLHPDPLASSDRPAQRQLDPDEATTILAESRGV